MHASTETTEHFNDALELIDAAQDALRRLQMVEPSHACSTALHALAGERQRLLQAWVGRTPDPAECVVRGAPLFDL